MGPQEDYIETVFTCEGDFDDPHLQDRLEDFQSSLKDLLLTDKNKLILKKVEPWNSVRVTFNIPREAASRLKQLAQQGNATLRDLGVLAVQILDQHISLTIAGRNNERTHLVFKTAETPGSSVFDSHPPSIDLLRPPGNVEATRKNIQEYLRHGSSLIDSLFGQPDGSKGRTPEVARPNNIYPGHQGELLHSTEPATTSPSVSAYSPSRSPVGSSSLKLSQPPGLPPGLPSGLPFGPANSLAGLPPPPPYPQGSTYMNNLQRLRFASSSASPLLVNLLQNDPGFSSFLTTGKIPSSLDPDALQPPKKKRKPRKPREKKVKNGAEGEVPLKSVPNSVLSSSVSHHSSSLPVFTQSMSMSQSDTSFVNCEPPGVKDHSMLQHPQAMHNIGVHNVHNDRVPLTYQQSSGIKTDMEVENTAGKIINPVTGLLEPVENLSDTSPAKGEAEKLSPKAISLRKTSGKAGEIISNLITSHIRSDNQGNSNCVNQRPFSEISHSHCATAGPASQRLENSSQLSGSSTSDSIERKQMHEAIRQEFINMIHKEKSKEPKKSDKVGQLVLPAKMAEHPVRSDMKDTETPLRHISKMKTVSLPQESDAKSIPQQLLNKPLMEVKHNSVGKPTGSPDSNGDSECSSQGVSVELHIAHDNTSSTNTAHTDPTLKSYNNDSGVGSSSERSEDPSEPGDNDFKGSHSNNNSFDSAKSQLMDPIKQTPPNAKGMIVGYTMADFAKDHKNNKIFSPYYKTNALVNSKVDTVNMKMDKADGLINHQAVFNKSHPHQMNSLEHSVKMSVSESINRKSPKLATNGPKPSHEQDMQMKSQFEYMSWSEPQCNPENSTTQKKKGSPRNSPRGSPRPRSSNSPRSNVNSRPSDPVASVGGSRLPYLTTQSYANHLPVRSESHLIMQHSELNRPSYSEQRMSTPSGSLPRANFSGLSGVDLENRREMMHSNIGGVDMAPVSMQHHNDVAALKSEPYHHSHLRHLSAIAGTKDPVILQRKLEELRPIFQQLQQQAAQAQLSVPTTANGTDQPHSPRSPVATRPRGQSPASTELLSNFDISTVRSNVHTSVTASSASQSNDSSINCSSSRVTKISEEQKGTSAMSGVRKSSPGVANTVPFNQYASSLPLPKRLTESVQKLVKPLPLDNSLPHQKSRSPSSSASTVKQGSSSTVSLPKTNARSVTSGINRTLVGDSSHLDIDSITPSITGFCFDGSLDLAHSLPHYTSASLNEELAMPVSQTMVTSVSAGTLINSGSQASTVLVPAVTGSVLSLKTHSSDSITVSAFPPSSMLPGGGYISNPVSTSSANISSTTLCNSDTKMANLIGVTERTVKPSVNATGPSPPLLHPFNARYPVLQHEDKPKSPYQQMGLSEMLQETANLHSISADRLPPHITSCTRRDTSCDSNKEIQSSSNLPIPVLTRQSSSPSDSKFVNFDPSASISELSVKSVVTSGLLSVSNSASLKTCINTNATSTVQTTAPLIISSKETSAPVNEDTIKDRPKFTSIETLNSESCSQDSAETISESLDLKALEQEKSETSQSGHDVLVKVQSSEKCDNVTLDKTDCDKLVVVPTSITMATVSSSSCATQPVSGSNSNVSLHNDRGSNNNRSSSPESLENSEISKITKVKTRSHAPPEESHEDKSISGACQASSDLDLAPRQLRSRKRTNTGESDSSNASEELNKKLRLDNSSEVSSKNDSSKDNKVGSVKTNSSPTLGSNELKHSDDSNTQTLIDTVKSGLRARTSLKSDEKDKSKTVVLKETRKDGKAIVKSVPEKKVDVSKSEEVRRNSQNRRSRQSPNLQEKPQNAPAGNRDKSPVRSRTRGRNSPVVVEQQEESQENKRKTRSAKSKVEAQSVEPAPVSKRRRTSRDHR